MYSCLSLFTLLLNPFYPLSCQGEKVTLFLNDMHFSSDRPQKILVYDSWKRYILSCIERKMISCMQLLSYPVISQIHGFITAFSLSNHINSMNWAPAYCLVICRVHLWLCKLAGRLSLMTSLLTQHPLQLCMELLLLHLKTTTHVVR